MNAVLRFLATWIEFPILLALLALMGVAYYAIPQIDPRSGIDGWGGLWNMLMVVFAAILASGIAWFVQRTYFRELLDHEEEQLAEIAVGVPDDPLEPPDPNVPRKKPWSPEEDKRWRARHAVWLLLLDRATFFAVFVPLFFALLGEL